MIPPGVMALQQRSTVLRPNRSSAGSETAVKNEKKARNPPDGPGLRTSLHITSPATATRAIGVRDVPLAKKPPFEGRTRPKYVLTTMAWGKRRVTIGAEGGARSWLAPVGPSAFWWAAMGMDAHGLPRSAHSCLRPSRIDVLHDSPCPESIVARGSVQFRQVFWMLPSQSSDTQSNERT
jgi:hypothetical protein